MTAYPIEYTQGSAAEPYETKVNPNGMVGCTCAGWRIKKAGKPRFCSHCVKYVAKHGLTVEERGDYVFVVDGRPAVASPPALRVIQGTSGPGQRIGNDAITAPLDGPEVGGFIEPMLASKLPDGYDADRYDAAAFVMEEKFDGIRLVVRVKAGAVRAWSRLANVRTLPAAMTAQLRLMPDGVYDGELLEGKHSYDVNEGDALVLFDVLEALGNSTFALSQDTRRALLEAAYGSFETPGPVTLTVQQPPSMKSVKEIWARGGEGAIIKSRHGTYRPGIRSGEWVKVKAVAAATLTIVGFKAGENGPHSAVLLRDAEGHETSAGARNAQAVREMDADPDSFLGRRLVVSFQERTPSGNYRHIVWDHLAGEAEA